MKTVKTICLFLITVTALVFTAEQTAPKYTGFPDNIIFNEENCPNDGTLEAFYYDGDGDGYGILDDPTPDDGNSYPIYACSTTPPFIELSNGEIIYYVSNSDDCDDTIAEIWALDECGDCGGTGPAEHFTCDGFKPETKNALQTAVDLWVDDNVNALDTYGEINNWDVSLITDMSGLFRYSSFNQDISNWDVSNVENMSQMFYWNSSYNQDISNWDVSNVENMSEMFYNGMSFNQEISNWDVSNVTNMTSMFHAAYSFNQDISSWDVSNVIYMNRMFELANNFNQDISNWDIPSNVNINRLFGSTGDGTYCNCLSLENQCAIFTAFSSNNSWNYDWSSSCPVPGCTNEHASNYNVDATVNDGSCTTTPISQDNIHSAVDLWCDDPITAEEAYGHISDWDVSSVTDMSELFNSEVNFNDDISDWNVSNVTNMHGMFEYAAIFNQYIGDWDVSNVTNMGHMFFFAYDFNQDISDWDVGNNQFFDNMFREAFDFNQDIGRWDVSNVFCNGVVNCSMNKMFKFAESFNQDLSGWCVTNVVPPFLAGWDFSAGSGLSGNQLPVWGTCPVQGCTTSNFTNYNPDATWDDGSCVDCNGVANGDAIEDECGVCGGDNSTCADCAGVPNGNSTTDFYYLDLDGDGLGAGSSYEICSVGVPEYYLYQENFVGQTHKGSLSEVGWTGSGAIKVGQVQSPPDLNNNQQWHDLVGTPDGDNWYAAKFVTGASGRLNLKTTENPISASNRAGLQFSVDYASKNNKGFRWNVQVDGNWYVTDEFGTNNHGSMSEHAVQEWKPGGESLNVESADWFSWSGGGDADNNSGVPISLPAGDITAFGIYLDNDNNADAFAIDNFRITVPGVGWVQNVDDQDDNCFSNTHDCNGACDGDALLDNCNVCDNDVSNDCTQDCANVWGGDALEDNCGNCDSDSNNDCTQDCAGDWGGSAIINECGECIPEISYKKSRISAGAEHTIILKADGTIENWGHLPHGNAPDDLSDVISVSAGHIHMMALKSDGTIVNWGYNSNSMNAIPAGLNNVVSIASGGRHGPNEHSLALKSDGTVVAWGINDFGQIDVPANLTNVVAIDGSSHSLALKSDGNIVAWGDNGFGQCDVPEGLDDVISIAAGVGHSLALKSDGTVVAWGDNDFGQIDIPDGLNNVIAIDGGYKYSLALLIDGTVIGWGRDNHGQISSTSNLIDIVEITAGWDHALAIKSDGAVFAWGNNLSNKSTVPEGIVAFVEEVCTQDCAGVWGGDAELDNCNVCDNDATNDCTLDCFGEWGGLAVDDCHGTCNGGAIVDECGDCVGGETGADACVQDCAGNWGGNLVNDVCGVCGGNGPDENYTCDGTFQPQTTEVLQSAVDLWVDDNATALTTYGEINSWDVSLITDMTGLFLNKSTFNSDISNWDVSNVNMMIAMFKNASSFNQDLSDWNVSSANIMILMFENASNFNGNISNWNLSNANNMGGMFKGATSFNQDLSNWDVSNVNIMNDIFKDASSFNGDITNWNTSNLHSLSSAFENAVNFNQELSNWDVSSAINMDNVFKGATNFNGNISNWNVSNVNTMGSAFENAINFNQDLSSWDVSNIYNAHDAFLNTPAISDENRCAINSTFSGIDDWQYSDWVGYCDDDGDGIINSAEVVGCQDSSACNYDENATDAGTCNIPTSCDTCNDDGSVNIEGDLDGICETCVNGSIVDNDEDNDEVCNSAEIVGCQDSDACNYDETATDTGSCNIPTFCDTCNADGTVNSNGNLDGICETCVEGLIIDNDEDNDEVCDSAEIVGCQDETACNYNANATDTDNDLCIFANGCETCSGATDGTGTIVDNDADDDGVCDSAEIDGCRDSSACNYDDNPTTDTDNELCVFASGCETCSGATDGTGTIVDNDADEDLVCNVDDNCEFVYNPNQENTDNDEFGDICDSSPGCQSNNVDVCGICDGPGYTTYFYDFDGDSLGDANVDSLQACQPIDGYVTDNTDACPYDYYNDQDNDGICANVDDDDDGDGCDDNVDDNPLVNGDDTDNDGIDDDCDPDDDNDGVADGTDSHSLDSSLCSDDDNDGCDDCAISSYDVLNDGLDTDLDGVCNLTDDDDDGDGCDDNVDDNPLVNGDDTDNDGIDDDCDSDDDNDGVADVDDSHSLDSSLCSDDDNDGCDDCAITSYDVSNDGTDTDTDGTCDLGDTDDDGDGCNDVDDDNPLTASIDTDNDGTANDCDTDDDNDGVADVDDSHSFDSSLCSDDDNDGCDDCAISSYDILNDGTDTDADGLCDAGDTDDDGDGCNDVDDDNPLTASIDTDGDGFANDCDDDDDGDNIVDESDSASLDMYVCSDLDADGCNDCSSGSFNLADDGVDTDGNGICNVGDLDDDGDGCDDEVDDNPLTASIDTDGDGFANDCDDDDDGDNIVDESDSASLDMYVCSDLDADGCDDCSSGAFNVDADGDDFDGDGLCDGGDPDDDNDGALDENDSNDSDSTVCSDNDNDTCDDCTHGSYNPEDDGLDTDNDGLCNAGDDDADNDGVENDQDSDDTLNTVCLDSDGDNCDDCSSGTYNPANDGDDYDLDGLCNVGDTDDDNDGVLDGADGNPQNAYICSDDDGDGCDDCSNGSYDVANDGDDSDSDGFCNSGDIEPDCANELEDGNQIPAIDECGICHGDGYSAFFIDVDGDGYGCNDNVINGCELPDGYADNNDDPECDCYNDDYTVLAIDDCGVCNGGGQSCPLGDVNNDDLLNVVDVIMVAGNILGQNEFEEWQTAVADMDDSGDISIVDIVLLVSSILGTDTLSRDIESIDLQLIGNRLEQDVILGIAYDITISHPENVDMEFEFSQDVMFADFVTEENSTRILIVNPQEKLIFNANTDFEIESVKVAYRDSYINYNITEIPQEFSVHTYPNPFNPVLNVEYSLPYENEVHISIFDINGQKIYEIDEGLQNAGTHNVQWEAVNVSSGLYFLKIESGQFNKIEKIMLVK